MQPDSPIANQVGAAQLPGADKVWNRDNGMWDAKYNQAPFFVWGWAVGVAGKSDNKDVAFDYLCFFANGANHQADIGIGRFGVNPFMEEDFKAVFGHKLVGMQTLLNHMSTHLLLWKKALTEYFH